MGSTTRTVVERFFGHLSKGEIEPAMALVSPELKYSMPGTCSLSGRAGSMAEFQTKILAALGPRLKSPLRIAAHEVIVDGDRAVALAKGQAEGAHGPYNNDYAFVFTVRDGKIVSMDEYLDTLLVETALFGKTLA